MGNILGMSGKSSQSDSSQYDIPAIETNTDDSEAVMALYAAQMGMMMSQQQSILSSALANSSTELPDAYTVDQTDWTERHESLKRRAASEYGTSIAARKGRLDTVLTSPMLDDEETNVFSVNLGK